MPGPASNDLPQLDRLLSLHQPDVVVTEQLFFATRDDRNAGWTSGRVVLLSAAQRGLPWSNTGVEVKLAVVGMAPRRRSSCSTWFSRYSVSIGAEA